MKRRFPGEVNGPPGSGQFDMRAGRSTAPQGRGGPPMMGRGPPGRFPGRGGPPPNPPFPFHGGRAPPMPMMGMDRHGRGLPPPLHAQGPPPRDMNNRGGLRGPGPPTNFGGRGGPPAMPLHPPGRGIPPPPPPRMNPGPVGAVFSNHPPPQHHSPALHPPPRHPESFPHHPTQPPTRPVVPTQFPPPPVMFHHPPPAPVLPPTATFPPPVPFAPQPNIAVAPPVAPYASTYPGTTPTAPPQPAGSLPAARPRVPTQQEIDAAWSEHADDKGVKFFHNTYLNESTYIKPTVLKNSEATDSTPLPKQWQEYTDPSSGKKYYSDGTTTTWEKPTDLHPSDVPDVGEAPEEQTKRRKKKVQQEDYTSKEEAIAAFKGLLLAKGIQPASKWNDVAKLLSSDARWEGFAESLSAGERKQALAEYQTKRANDLKNQERQERIRAKEAFGQLLTDVLQTISGFSAGNPRFSDVRATLAKDDRFHGVSDEATRESLFFDFCEELRKREQRKKWAKKREILDSFNSFLREKEEIGILTFASTWDLFLSKLTTEEKDDSRFKITSSLDENQRQIYFADFVIQLQAEEDDKRRRIQDARYRAEKAQREAYRDILKYLSSQGKIRPYTSWRAIVEFIEGEEAFKAVLGQDQDAPMEIFEEFVDEWDKAYYRERTLLSRVIDETWGGEAIVKPNTSFEEFTNSLFQRLERPSDIYSDIKRIMNREEPVSTARLYWEELLSKAQHTLNRQGPQVDYDESSEDEGEIIEEEATDPEPKSRNQSLEVDNTEQDIPPASNSVGI